MWKTFVEKKTVIAQLNKDGYIKVRISDNVLDEEDWTITKVIPEKFTEVIQNGVYRPIDSRRTLDSIIKANNIDSTGRYPEILVEIWIDN